MRFRHAVHIASENFSSVFKLLLYRLFSMAIFGSLVYVILSTGLSAITHGAEVARIEDLIGQFFDGIFTGRPDVLQALPAQFKEAIKDLLSCIAFNTPSIIGCVFGVIGLYLLHRFVDGLAIFSIANVVNDRMSSYSHTTFSRSYFMSIGKAALYQVIYVPLCFVYDALMLGGCFLFFFYLPSSLPSWGFVTVLIAVSMTLTAVVLLESLKMTLISAWIPAIVEDGDSVTHAFRASLKMRKGFGVRYISFLAAIYLIIAVNVLFAFATVGSALLVTVPLSYIFLLSLQFVNYYYESGKKFFLTRNRIFDASEEQI